MYCTFTVWPLCIFQLSVCAKSEPSCHIQLLYSLHNQLTIGQAKVGFRVTVTELLIAAMKATDQVILGSCLLVHRVYLVAVNRATDRLVATDLPVSRPDTLHSDSESSWRKSRFLEPVEILTNVLCFCSWDSRARSFRRLHKAAQRNQILATPAVPTATRSKYIELALCVVTAVHMLSWRGTALISTTLSSTPGCSTIPCTAHRVFLLVCHNCRPLYCYHCPDIINMRQRDAANIRTANVPLYPTSLSWRKEKTQSRNRHARCVLACTILNQLNSFHKIWCESCDTRT